VIVPSKKPDWMSQKNAFLLGGGALAVLALAVARKYRSLTPGDYYFPYKDAEYLGAGQGLGGQAYVPPGARNNARLLVYLHGNNDGGMLHAGLGATDTAYDLRSIVPSDTILAAPSQNKNASGSGLWSKFNLDDFVAAVEEATGATIDRSQVILMGHSGAGCSSVGGLLSPLGTIKPQLVAAVDVCAGSSYGDAFGKLAEQVPMRVFYQTRSWARDFAGFQAALKNRATFEEVQTPTGQNPHDAIVPLAVRAVLT
jgi:poly(3-hydroxybutyrate) depolymerase